MGSQEETIGEQRGKLFLFIMLPISALYACISGVNNEYNIIIEVGVLCKSAYC